MRIIELRARPRLVRVVEGDPDDGRWNSLLLAVELPDLDCSSELAVLSRNPTESDVLLQDRAACPARDDADLLPPGVDAVAMSCGLVPVELEADESALRVLLAFLERGSPDEIVLCL